MKMAACWVAMPRGLVRMQAVQTSETSVNSYQSTRRYNPEDSHLQTFGYFLPLDTVITYG
jgi:hypothetical protein